MSFIFGGDTGITYEQLQQRKKIAEQLRAANARTPRNVGEGIHAVARAIVARGADRQAAKAEKAQRDEFSAAFDKLAPNSQGLIDLANSPYATTAHKSVIDALMKGAPNYKMGTGFHRGGKAVVGENGPEVVELPYGSSVTPMTPPKTHFGMGLDPADADFLFELPDPIRGKAIQRIEGGESPSDVLMEIFEQQQQMQQYDPASQQRMRDSGDLPSVPEFDGRELLGPESNLRQNRFDDARAVRAADLDAFKLMQLEPQYDAPVPNDANSTEARRLQLLRRAMFADAALEDPRLARAMTRLDNNMAGGLGALGRMYTNDEYELGRLMAEQFASAILRGDSGAQTPEPEVQRYIRQYFPLSGETDEQIQAKRAMRREEIRAMMQSMPEDARPVVEQIQREIEELKKQADVPDGSLTGATDISDEDKEFLKSLGIE